MTLSHINVQPQQPFDVAAFIAGIQTEQRRIMGVCRSRNIGNSQRLAPATYIASCLNAADRELDDNPERFNAFLQFIYRVRSAINSLATHLGAAASERTYLTALIDVLQLNPLSVLRGNYRVRLSAKEAGELVSLSPSSCTTARNGLSAKGLILADGDHIDLAPLIETLAPIMLDTAVSRLHQIQESIPVICDPMPESGTTGSNVIVSVSSKEKTMTIGSSPDLFADEAIRSTIELSPKLKQTIEDLLCSDIRDCGTDEILASLGKAANSIFDGWNYETAWATHGWKKHGLQALSALVAAVEAPRGKVESPGRWLWGLLKLPKLDASSNINGLIASREKARKQALSLANAKKAEEERARVRSRQAVLARSALAALDDMRATRAITASDHHWMMLPDRIQILDDGERIRVCLRKPINKDDAYSCEAIVKLLSSRLFPSGFIYQIGTIAGTPSISAFI